MGLKNKLCKYHIGYVCFNIWISLEMWRWTRLSSFWNVLKILFPEKILALLIVHQVSTSRQMRYVQTAHCAVRARDVSDMPNLTESIPRFIRIMNRIVGTKKISVHQKIPVSYRVGLSANRTLLFVLCGVS